MPPRTTPPVEPDSGSKSAAKAPAKTPAKAAPNAAQKASTKAVPKIAVKADAKLPTGTARKAAPTAVLKSKAAPASDASLAEADVAKQPAKKRLLRRIPRKVIIAVGVPILVLGSVGGWTAVNHQYLVDQVAVWTYDPSPTIHNYTDDASLTGKGMFLFDASKPRISPNSEFNQVCGSNEGGDGVIGCYLPHDKRIVLFEISDERLAGLRVAVAAHEMLHAAWDRMDSSEHTRLKPLLDAEVKRMAKNIDFTNQLDAYKFSDDDTRYNELHSLIGTEVPGISAELEKYYSQYFVDRASLVAEYLTANDVLVGISKKVTVLSNAIQALNDQIDSEYKSYQDGYDQLSKDVDAFNARNNAYYYTTQSAFNRDKNALISRQHELDTLFEKIQGELDDYDAKVSDLTDLDQKAAELYKSINIQQQSAAL